MSSIEKDVLTDGLVDWLSDMGLTHDNVLYNDIEELYYVNQLNEDGWKRVYLPAIYQQLVIR